MLLSKCQIFSTFAPENKLQIVPVDLRSVKNSSMRLCRDKQLFNNYGTIWNNYLTTMEQSGTTI